MIGNNGRGSTQSFPHRDIINTDGIPHLSNDQRLPVTVIMTCVNGCFAMPNASRSLAEENLLSGAAGAVAAFASTPLTRAQVHKLLDQGLLEAIFQEMFTRSD